MVLNNVSGNWSSVLLLQGKVIVVIVGEFVLLWANGMISSRDGLFCAIVSCKL